MKIKIQLIPLDVRAADRSLVSKEVAERYLKSEKYFELLETGAAIGGITHYDRYVREKDAKIGQRDQMFRSGNMTHNLTTLTIENGWLMGISEIFDSRKFSADIAENIKKVKGLLRSGVFVPISGSINANWSMSDEALNIIEIQGYDFTWDPSWKGSRVVAILEDDDDL